MSRQLSGWLLRLLMGQPIGAESFSGFSAISGVLCDLCG